MAKGDDQCGWKSCTFSRQFRVAPIDKYLDQPRDFCVLHTMISSVKYLDWKNVSHVERAAVLNQVAAVLYDTQGELCICSPPDPRDIAHGFCLGCKSMIIVPDVKVEM